MCPILFKFGPFNLYAYGLMCAIGFLVVLYLVISEARRRGFNLDLVFNLCFFVFILGLLGARIFFVIENFSYYKKFPWEVFMLWQGGLSWFGGFLLGLLGGIIYLKRKNSSVYPVLDLVVPYLALGQSIGRIGCFLNGCCFGKETLNWGIYFPVHNAILIPTQLYSSVGLIFIFLLLRTIKIKKEGVVFYLYLLLYSILRFFIEFWRADNPRIFFDLTLFQLLSIGLFFAGLIGVLLRLR